MINLESLREIYKNKNNPQPVQKQENEIIAEDILVSLENFLQLKSTEEIGRVPEFIILLMKPDMFYIPQNAIYHATARIGNSSSVPEIIQKINARGIQATSEYSDTIIKIPMNQFKQ